MISIHRIDQMWCIKFDGRSLAMPSLHDCISLLDKNTGIAPCEAVHCISCVHKYVCKEAS